MVKLLQLADNRDPNPAAQATKCPSCARLLVVCVCHYEARYQTRPQLLILQHPREQDVLLGTAALLRHCLPASLLRVGLSWPSLRGALGEEAQASRWA
ncbi:MAG: DTW domain-containing protein, partial [Deltaproteobacteria bacterium]